MSGTAFLMCSPGHPARCVPQASSSFGAAGTLFSCLTRSCPARISKARSTSRLVMASAPLSAGALAELRTLCSAAQCDPSLLHHASLADLRALLRSLGATLPPETATPGAAAASNDDDDLRDDECVAQPDTPSQEMGPPPGAAEPSEEVRVQRACGMSAVWRSKETRVSGDGFSWAPPDAAAALFRRRKRRRGRHVMPQRRRSRLATSTLLLPHTRQRSRHASSEHASVCYPRRADVQHAPRARRPRRLRCCTPSAPRSSSS
jgi:hypothetical protein